MQGCNTGVFIKSIDINRTVLWGEAKGPAPWTYILKRHRIVHENYLIITNTIQQYFKLLCLIDLQLITARLYIKSLIIVRNYIILQELIDVENEKPFSHDTPTWVSTQ